MKNKKIKNIYKAGLVIMFFTMAIFYHHLNALAETPTTTTSAELTADEQKKIDDKNKELEKLDEKAATYEKILLLKQKQKTLLGSQIINLNSDITDIRGEINNNVSEIVLIGEIGGTEEIEAAKYIKDNVTKSVYDYIAGHHAPPGVQMGHAGAILGSKAESARAKTEALANAGAHTANSIDGLIQLILNR
jgi:hypothetical protein